MAEKRKIAILGGGIGALTAAFEITDDSHWQEQYEVTVYQMGWRLGGKGASGRNKDALQRIEEHGLHILMGFYENAFSIIKRCFAELGRSPDQPLATWKDAFKPHDYIVLMEAVGNQWEPWPVLFPRNSQEPGTGQVLPSPRSYVQMIRGWLKQILRSSAHLLRIPERWDALEETNDADDRSVHRQFVQLHDSLHGAAAHRLDDRADLRRAFVSIDLGVAAIRGMIADDILSPPYDWFKIDDIDFRAWLTAHGAHKVSVSSAYVNGIYDLIFSEYSGVGAGTALHGLLRMVCTYKGAIFWKMQAGMGDTIFAPLYQVLRRRGVRFRFFHRVDELHVAPQGNVIDRVTLGRQVTAKGDDYDPLVDVKGLPCWPSEPIYDRIVEGEALQASGANLEDWWTKWKDTAPPLVLERGTDFDEVVLGISIGAFPYICQQLMDVSEPFRAMVAKVATTQTQSVQLWMTKDLSGLGWKHLSPVMDAYAEPLNTWADMTHLVPREDWPVGEEPRNIAYLTGCLPDDDPKSPLAPRSDDRYTERQHDRVRENAVAWLNRKVQPLWPAATRADDPQGLDWQILAAPGSAATGVGRFDTQYWVATLNPSDRYVLAVPGSVKYRLASNGTGFHNLYLAGDYVRTSLSCGCVEAATMGGMHASRAICGRPERIIGDADDAQAVGDSQVNRECPPYIEAGGSIVVMSQPLALNDTTMYVMLVGAQMAALRQLVDNQLNAVADGVTTYRPLLPMVAVVCADIRRACSLVEPDRDKGWIGERDFGFWVPVVRGKLAGSIFHAESVAWFLPYLFVDNDLAMATGREVFGFHKQTARLEMPSSPDASGSFSIDTLLIERFARESQVNVGRLVEIRSTVGATGIAGSAWSSAREVFAYLEREALKHWSTVSSEIPVPSWVLLRELWSDFATGRVPMVFLKQFRDAADGKRACYQALIEAPARLTHWHGGNLLHPHDIQILPADSHPVARDLGLGSSPVRARLGFWTRINFVMEAGRVIAER